MHIEVPPVTSPELLDSIEGESSAAVAARTFHRVLKIARTIADLAESEVIRTAHVAEAIQYQGLHRSVPGSTDS